jgi:hypothetical protein
VAIHRGHVERAPRRHPEPEPRAVIGVSTILLDGDVGSPRETPSRSGHPELIAAARSHQ